MLASLQIDDDVYEEARRLAAAQQQTIGKILSNLARRALGTERPSEGGFPHFSVPEGTPQITLEMVKAAESDT
jgi:hypothetical protein